MRSSASLRNPERHCGCERPLDAAHAAAAVGGAQRRQQIALAQQPHEHVRRCAIRRHRDVEMLHARLDVGDDVGDLRGAVRLCAVLHEDAHGAVVFADSVDASGEPHLGAERDLEKSVEDFSVGERLALGGAALGDFAVFGVRGDREADCRNQDATAESSPRQAPQRHVAEVSREERA